MVSRDNLIGTSITNNRCRHLLIMVSFALKPLGTWLSRTWIIDIFVCLRFVWLLCGEDEHLHNWQVWWLALRIWFSTPTFLDNHIGQTMDSITLSRWEIMLYVVYVCYIWIFLFDLFYMFFFGFHFAVDNTINNL